MIREMINKVKAFMSKAVNRGIAVVLVLLFFYLAGILAQFLNNWYLWAPGKELRLPSLNPLKGLAMIFTPFGAKAVIGLFCFLLISGLLFYLFSDDRSHLKYDKKRKFYYSKNGTYGTAGGMDETRVEEVFNLTPEDAAGSVREIIYGVKEGNVISRNDFFEGESGELGDDDAVESPDRPNRIRRRNRENEPTILDGDGRIVYDCSDSGQPPHSQ